MARYQFHGPGLTNYKEDPDMYVDLNISEVTRPNQGDDITCTVTASLVGIGGDTYFGYDINLYVTLDSTSEPQDPGDNVAGDRIIRKPNSPNQWSTGDYTGTKTLKSTNKTTTAKLYLWMKSNCTCQGNPSGSSDNKKLIVQTITLTAPEAGKPPEKPTLTNNNKYNNPATGIQSGVSASTTSLTIGVSTTQWGEPDAAKIYWECNNGGGSGNTAKASQFTINGLKAGTTYTVTVYLKNSKGSSSSSSITIRTKYNAPIVSISLDDVDLEQLIFNWSSDKSLKSTEYKIDGGSWVSLGQTGTSGTFTAQWFDPKTTHTIYFRGTSTNALDALLSSQKSASGTTHDRGHIVSIGDCTFGLNIELDIESESDKQLKIEVWTEGNGLSPRFIYDNIGSGDRTWTFVPTQDQLDKMYRCYPKSNTIPIHFLLTTHGEWKDWEDDQQDKTLTLTGIAKTAHAGDNSNKPRRCQVWVGDSSNKPRRAVGWVGVDGQSRRTI